jgi:hypothetical protein
VKIAYRIPPPHGSPFSRPDAPEFLRIGDP